MKVRGKDEQRSAFEFENDRIEEIRLARLGDSRMTVAGNAIPGFQSGIHRIVLHLKPALPPIPIRRKRINAETHANRVVPPLQIVCPMAEACRIHLKIDGKRSFRLIGRNAHVAVDATPESRERDAVEVKTRRTALRHFRHPRIERNFTGETRAPPEPEAVEVRGGRASLSDLLRLEGNAEHERIVPSVFRRHQRKPQKSGLVQRAGHGERHTGFRHVKRKVGQDRRSEVVQLGVGTRGGGKIAGRKKTHRKARPLPAAVNAAGSIRIHFVRRRASGERKRDKNGRG